VEIAALAIRLERARLSEAPIDILTMLDIRHPMVWLIGASALAALGLLARGHFSPEARARRRREKSNRPLISRKRGPSVRLAVKADKPKRDPKG
jgi:hypothetical protein